MYLFSRTVRMAPGHIRESGAWALAITEKVNQIVTTPVRLWSPAFSPGIDSLMWTTMVEGFADLEANEAKLAADEGYLDLTDAGAAFGSGDAVNDQLIQIVHGDVDPSRDIQYVTSVRATIAPGSLAKGMAAGVEIADKASAITGITTLFGVDSTGEYGSVRWISAYESVQLLQQAGDALNADATFLTFVDSVSAGVYQPGVAETVYRRIV